MEYNRAGFTLVELLIVMVVISILATVGMARFEKVRKEAFAAALVSDLKNLSIEQELYHGRAITYAALSDLPDFQMSDGVNISLTVQTASGWAAIGSHTGLPGFECGIFIGTATAADAPPATTEGDIACTQ